MTTFATLRTQHADTLRRCNAGPITPELIKEVGGFIETVRKAGRDIADEDDRDYLRGLLTFWGNWYYNQTRTYPNTNLELATPEATLAHNRDMAKQVVKSGLASAPPNRLFSCGGWLLIGGVGLIAMVALFAAVIPLWFDSTQASPPATVENLSGVQETIEAMTTTIALIDEPTNPPALTAVGVTPPPTATPVIPTTTPLALPSPTSDDAGDSPTSTPESGIGGGGFTPSIGFLSVQIVEPSSSDSLVVNQPFNVGAAYSNLQPGWALFYVFESFDTYTALVMPPVFEIGFFNGIGVWTESVQVAQPGYYEIAVFITTTAESRQVLERYANAGAPLPNDFSLDGVIVFRRLAAVQVY